MSNQLVRSSGRTTSPLAQRHNTHLSKSELKLVTELDKRLLIQACETRKAQAASTCIAAVANQTATDYQQIGQHHGAVLESMKGSSMEVYVDTFVNDSMQDAAQHLHAVQDIFQQTIERELAEPLYLPEQKRGVFRW